MVDDMEGGITSSVDLDLPPSDSADYGSFDMCGGLDLGGLGEAGDEGTVDFASDAEGGSTGFGCGLDSSFSTAADPGSLSCHPGLEGAESGVDVQLEPKVGEGLGEDLGGQLEIADEIGEFEGLMDGINPGFDPFSDGPSSTNCGACALALEARLSGADPDAVAGLGNVGSVAEMNRATGMEQVTMSPSAIASYAESMGPGYHAIVGFDRASGNDGHWFNVAVSASGRVYALDSQCGMAAPFGEYVKNYADDGVNFDISMRRG